MNKDNIPKKGTSQWRKNETIINNNPALKQARDISEGLEKTKPGAYTNNGGKGSSARPGTYSQAYKDGWERIFGGDKKNVNHKDEADNSGD